MNNQIYLKTVLAEMRKMDTPKKPKLFNIKVREFNRQNKAAGRVREYSDCELMRKSNKKKVLKEPNHWQNRTRNIKLKDGSIKKIHTIFIVEFNGQKVIY